MTRFLILLAPVLFNFLTVVAQVSDINDSSRSSQDEIAIENRLVALALKSPSYSISNHNNKIYEYDLKRIKNSWLNLLSISINYNDQTFAKSSSQATYVYPKYYFGVTIPIGLIFLQPTNVKAAKEAVAVGKDKQAELARELKAEVLKKYKEYKLYEDLLRMQSTLINDVLANASQAEENFKKGSITVEAYILTQRSSSEELAKNMNLRLQQDLIKLDIEKMIGVPLESVLRYHR